jgi:hypothetical protein
VQYSAKTQLVAVGCVDGFARITKSSLANMKLKRSLRRDCTGAVVQLPL